MENLTTLGALKMKAIMFMQRKQCGDVIGCRDVYNDLMLTYSQHFGHLHCFSFIILLYFRYLVQGCK